MALSFPLSIPTTIGIESIEFRAVNAVTTTQSPFTYKQQIIAHQGQRWEASVTIPALRRDLMADWKAFLVALKGPTGTFLLSDPDYATPRGTITSCVLNGAASAGAETLAVTMSGTLLAGDYIQLGTGANSRLHQVLQDQSGSGTLSIWPKLRTSYLTGSSVTFNEAKGVFRLASNVSSWSINNASAYGISFDCVEDLF